MTFRIRIEVNFGYDKICLKLFPTVLSWLEAEHECQRNNGDLVQIKNEQEQKDFDLWHRQKIDQYYNDNPDEAYEDKVLEIFSTRFDDFLDFINSLLFNEIFKNFFKTHF